MNEGHTVLSVLPSVASLATTMPSSTKPPKATANTASSTVRPPDTSQAGAHGYIYPIALLSMFYLSFPALVLDPTSTLAWTLPPLLVFQIGHSFTCLPSALSASTSALTTPGKAERPRKRNADKGSIFAGQFVVSQTYVESYTESLMADNFDSLLYYPRSWLWRLGRQSFLWR